MATERNKIFVSYSTSDTEIAQRVKMSLLRLGFQCWKAPEDIMPGESWPRAITRALQESWAMVLICSRHSIQSAEVSKELTLAMSGKVYVVPFRIDNIVPTGEWAYHLANIQWFDAFDRDPDSACEALAEHLKNTRGDVPFNTPPLAAQQSADLLQRIKGMLQAYMEGLVAETGALADFFTTTKLNRQGNLQPGGHGAMNLSMMVKERQASGGFDLKALGRAGGRWIVTGLPGSGKSTLVKMIALDAAKEALADATGRDRIPILLELGRYEKNSLLGLSQVREALSRHAGRDFTDADVKTILDSREIFWVMDGLDEGMIGETKVNESPLWREIEALVSRYPAHAYVISTRKTHIPSGNRFETIAIRPLDAAECRAFIGKYLDYFQSGAAAAEVYEAIPESLRKVADTPLLLSMVIAAYLNSGRVPGSIQELYREFVAHTLREVEAGRSTKVEPYLKDMALAALAFDMLTSSKSAFRSGDAAASIGRRIRQLGERGESRDASGAAAVLSELVYSGLLVERDYQVSFAHMTLLEYCAECEMSREYNFTASAEMDQHFLRNPDKIALILRSAAIAPGDRVIEVGAGIGSVAKHFPACRSLHLVDLDPDLVKILRHQFPDGNVLERDALEVLNEFPCDVLISNLPFFLTTGILDILVGKPFARAVMSVHADDDLGMYEGRLKIRTLSILDEQDFFPRQPFKSKLILVEPVNPPMSQ